MLRVPSSLACLPLALQAIIDDQSKTEAQRKAAREALKKQAEEARAFAAAIEREKKEKEDLEARIKEMEGKVGRGSTALHVGCLRVCTRPFYTAVHDLALSITPRDAAVDWLTYLLALPLCGPWYNPDLLADCSRWREYAG